MTIEVRGSVLWPLASRHTDRDCHNHMIEPQAVEAVSTFPIQNIDQRVTKADLSDKDFLALH